MYMCIYVLMEHIHIYPCSRGWGLRVKTFLLPGTAPPGDPLELNIKEK